MCRYDSTERNGCKGFSWSDEVKSGLKKKALPGMSAFYRAHPTARRHKIGEGGIPLDEFLSTPIREWVG
jgi:uncharacterized protein